MRYRTGGKFQIIDSNSIPYIGDMGTLIAVWWDIWGWRMVTHVRIFCKREREDFSTCVSHE